jgi:hypothetical protein
MQKWSDTGRALFPEDDEIGRLSGLIDTHLKSNRPFAGPEGGV